MRRQKILIPSAEVTADQLARAIGEQLLVHRTRQNLTPRKVHARGGPTPPTVQAIEQGQIGTWASVAQYCDALGVGIADLLRNLLAAAPLSPDEQTLVHLYAEMTSEARSLYLLLGQQMPRPGRAPARREPAPAPARPPRPPDSTT